MTGGVDSLIAQYAVIEVGRTEGPSECIVIAYPDEDSLRDLIAGPSIIGCRFASREEAQGTIDANFWKASRGLTVEGAEKCPGGALTAKPCLGAGFDRGPTGGIVHGFPQAAAATAILIFYSRNAVSTVIRSFVGG